MVLAARAMAEEAKAHQARRQWQAADGRALQAVPRGRAGEALSRRQSGANAAARRRRGLGLADGGRSPPRATGSPSAASTSRRPASRSIPRAVKQNTRLVVVLTVARPAQRADAATSCWSIRCRPASRSRIRRWSSSGDRPASVARRHDLGQPYRVPRRPLRRGVQQFDRQVRLHGPRRGARHLCPSRRQRRGHVPSRNQRPHGHRTVDGDGALR